jgi:hypothetical protein
MSKDKVLNENEISSKYEEWLAINPKFSIRYFISNFPPEAD